MLIWDHFEFTMCSIATQSQNKSHEPNIYKCDLKWYIDKGGVDSFRISSLKTMAVEIYKVLNGMNPEYLSPLLSRSTTPYNLRDNNKLIQPIKRTTTYGIKSLAYYGTHLWNLLPLDVKGAITLNNFKTLMRKWAGPTCGCSVCDMVI